MISFPSEAGVEEVVVIVVLWLRLIIEAIGALVIGLGMVLATLRFLRGSFPPQVKDFHYRAADAGALLGNSPRVSAWRGHSLHGSRTELGRDWQARCDSV
jgi:hypothetical protein